MRTISHKDLPNADLSTVGIIPLFNLFPIEARYLDDCPAYIHYDGSLMRFFELPSIDTPSLSIAIKSMDDGTAMQIYRHHTPQRESYYLSLRKQIDYSGVIPTSIIQKVSLSPICTQINRISRLTREANESLDEVISKIDHRETDYLQSELPHILFDFNIDKGVVHADPVRTNFSFLKIGESKYGTIASLNNMTQIPQTGRCAGKHTFLERIVLVAPSKERRRQLQESILDNARLIEHLTEKKGTDYSVDTLANGINDIIPRGGKVLYSDVTFFLTAPSMSELIDRFQSFHDCMEEHDIALYCHTNTSRKSYISMFPGNDVYNGRYTLLFEYFLNILMWKALEL